MQKGKLATNVEYGALRAACALLNAIPYPIATALARGVARLLVGAGFQRKRTFERIRTVFPEKGRREVREIAVRSLQGVLLNAVEMMRAPRLDRAWMDRHVEGGAHYKDILQKLVDEGNGVVIMVPHSGNWYMAAWAMAKYGQPLIALAARQRNPKLDAWMHRQYGDIEVLDRNCRETLGLIKEKLRAGRAFAILPDLRVAHPDVEVDFLNGRANVSHAGAMFAVRCKAPIVVAQMRREGTRHVIHYLATLRPDPSAEPKAEAVRLTRETMRLLSAAILEDPGDWFWYNKRWILQPVRSAAKARSNVV